MNWPDLMYVLTKCNGMNLTDEQVLRLLSSERWQLLCSYPCSGRRSALLPLLQQLRQSHDEG